jgi:hypothetical protein
MVKRKRQRIPPNKSQRPGSIGSARKPDGGADDSRQRPIWPVLSSPAHQLEDSEWWPPEKLLAHQLYQIQNLIDRAQTTVPFHKERLAPFAGWPPGALTLERFRDIPIMSRVEVQSAGKGLPLGRSRPPVPPVDPCRSCTPECRPP